MYITRNKKYVLTSVHLLLPFIDKYRILKGTYRRRNTILLHFQFSYINSYCSAMSISIFANFNLTGRHNWTIDQGNAGLKIDRLKQLYVDTYRFPHLTPSIGPMLWMNHIPTIWLVSRDYLCEVEFHTLNTGRFSHDIHPYTGYIVCMPAYMSRMGLSQLCCKHWSSVSWTDL